MTAAPHLEPFASPASPKPEGLRDTIESIVIAFIFAFVFRAFVVEAFVIPTGSMAPTLYGLHGQHRCECCKYTYAYGIREDAPPNARSFPVPCPNCGWDGDGNSKDDTVTPFDADAGDRILVLKWPYDVGGPMLGPQRWDVVVFKDPQDGEQNFIKRLIGLPGEVLEIIDGDIYTCPIGELSAGLRAELSKPRRPIIGDDSRYQHLAPAHVAELNQKLRIARKTPVAQDSLWLVHYEQDYLPDPKLVNGSGNPVWNAPRWEPVIQSNASPWNTASTRVSFTPTDHAEHGIRLGGRAIQDRYGYDPPMPGMGKGDSPVNVGDVRLSFLLTPRGRDGSMSLMLGKGDAEFRVRMKVDGEVILERVLKDGVPVQLSSASAPAMEPGKPIDVVFSNVDYRVSLSLDGREVVATTDHQYRPDVARLRAMSDGSGSLARVEMVARDLPLEIQHLAVHRDVYYRSTNVGLQPPPNTEYAGGPGWGTTNNPILLRDKPGDFFCCGDNSPQSKDSRMWLDVAPLLRERERLGTWTYQNGTVPEDQMIGRAFFVYWPSGFRVFSTRYGIVPNVGRMRIIR